MEALLFFFSLLQRDGSLLTAVQFININKEYIYELLQSVNISLEFRKVNNTTPLLIHRMYTPIVVLN